jgi:hypothetical protein
MASFSALSILLTGSLVTSFPFIVIDRVFIIAMKILLSYSFMAVGLSHWAVASENAAVAVDMISTGANNMGK